MTNYRNIRIGIFIAAMWVGLAGHAEQINPEPVSPAQVSLGADNSSSVSSSESSSSNQSISSKQAFKKKLIEKQSVEREQIDLEKIADELKQNWDNVQAPTGGLSMVVGNRVYTLRLGKQEEGMFELASTSKAFTGLLIALLEQEGVLNREDLITQWIPELTENLQMNYSSIQIQNLLFHNSGISSDTLDLLQPNTNQSALSQLPELLKNVPLTHAAGTHQEYATLNYSLLGLVAERATGHSFATLLREKVFLPLGMKHTVVEGSAPAENAVAETSQSTRIPGYKISFMAALPYDAPRYWQNAPAGYVLSTPQDMAVWLQFLLHRLPLEQEGHSLSALYKALEQAKRPYAGEGGLGYAYGWDVETDNVLGYASTHWSHPGQNPNAAAYVAFDPEAGVGVTLLGNSNSPQIMALGQSIFKYLRGASPQLLPENPSIDMNDWVSSVLAVIFWLGGALLLLAFIYQYKSGKKQFNYDYFIKHLSIHFIVLNVALIALLALVPRLLLGLGWSSLWVWGPLSLPVAAAGLILFVNAIALFFSPLAKSKDRLQRVEGNES
ncbi:putative penicillin binding protein [Xenorhabdus mauleonii]|uniref:CubicO group peptidase, beta-lactamase class C family n=1 Tax=Xenorhabdus mauleonii TaxID=351675 RepID=A0A1I3JGN2_9GAMM|nr:serine hydrolase domain-containing protein [Xenorhabdus mauleonii]PHM46205.1 putative penicillin binding protein [Xenorhabdus mauleonii]SFI59399.1 CubicO group peptidase, beta-lactamase class C family [Xenorhabdus mauleonii]